MISNEFHEFESLTINLPKSMPLGNRVAEARRQISEWLESLDKSFNHKTLRLKKIEESDKEYIYHYEIQRRAIGERILH